MVDITMSQAERTFGPLLADRDCGGCTACCTVPAIEELQKPADTTCAHCVVNGCSIYEDRPVPCRTFFCGWRRLRTLPDDLRPDRCGVLVMLEVDQAAANPFDRVCLVARWLVDRPVLEGELPARLRQLLGKGFVPLFFSPFESSRKFLVHPSPEVYDAIVNGNRRGGDIKTRVKKWQSALRRRSVARAWLAGDSDSRA